MLVLFKKWNISTTKKICRSFGNFMSFISSRFLFLRLRYLFLIVAVVAVCLEILVPLINRALWPFVIKKVDNFNSSTSLRVLFLGSVELVPDRHISGVFDFLYQRDSENFLSDSYSTVVSLTNPHMIVVSGRIMGGTASLGSGYIHEEVEEVMTKFNEMFMVQKLVYQGVDFSIFLDKLDQTLVTSSCLITCPNIIKNLTKLAVIQQPCSNHINGTVFIHHVNGLCPDDQKQPFDSPLRFAIIHSPSMVFGSFTPITFNKYRDFEPNLIVLANSAKIGVSFCSNCLSLVGGGRPPPLSSHWIELGRDSDPLTFRLPARTDGGGRGGTQPHVCIPPASYKSLGKLVLNGFGANSLSGFGVGVIDIPSQMMSYFILWNYDRRIMFLIYKIVIILSSIRLALFLLVTTRLCMDPMNWRLGSSTRLFANTHL